MSGTGACQEAMAGRFRAPIQSAVAHLSLVFTVCQCVMAVSAVSCSQVVWFQLSFWQMFPPELCTEPRYRGSVGC